jgi:hypothetical protein
VTGIDWARLPLLALMLVLLVAGSAALLRDQQSAAALVLLTAGMVTLGSWITVEAIAWHHRLHRHDQEDPGDAEQ